MVCKKGMIIKQIVIFLQNMKANDLLYKKVNFNKQ